MEPGLSSITDFKKQLEENIIYVSKLDIFSNLKAFDRIDVVWENNINMQVSKLINVNLNFDILYDKDISDRRQIRQALAVGLTYSFL